MKKYIFSMICMIISIACGISYNTIGSNVLADGTLSEPFALIPLSYLFGLLAIVSASIVFIVQKIKCKKTSN